VSPCVNVYFKGTGPSFSWRALALLSLTSTWCRPHIEPIQKTLGSLFTASWLILIP